MNRKPHILLSMANNETTPYFSRFAKENYHLENVKLSYLLLYPSTL